MRKPLAVVALIVALAGVGAWNTFVPTSPEHSCTVTGKDRSWQHSKHGSSSQYRIYTSDCGVFKVADTWAHWNFRSADRYGALQEGHSYTFTTYGHRFGLFSWFPNIVKAVEVSK
ncbi:hypothetical protein ACWGJ9_09825 [Curtobacterium citreum]